MNIEDELTGSFKQMATDSPTPAEIRTAIQNRRLQKRRQRQAIWAGCATMAAVGLIATATSLLSSPGPQFEAGAQPGTTVIRDVEGSSARCYASTDLTRPDNHLAISIGPDGTKMGPHALEICQQNWKDGTLSPSEPFIVDNPTFTDLHPIPDLVACVLPAELSDEGKQEVAIFPGDTQTCPTLNLPHYAP